MEAGHKVARQKSPSVTEERKKALAKHGSWPETSTGRLEAFAISRLLTKSYLPAKTSGTSEAIGLYLLRRSKEA